MFIHKMHITLDVLLAVNLTISFITIYYYYYTRNIKGVPGPVPRSVACWCLFLLSHSHPSLHREPFTGHL